MLLRGDTTLLMKTYGSEILSVSIRAGVALLMKTYASEMSCEQVS